MEEMAPEVLFEVLPTEVAFISNNTYKVGVGIGLNKSAPYSTKKRS